MVTRYVDSLLGNDANDGLAAVTGGGHGPKQTLTGAEDSPVAAGDVVYVRPGVYRELWTWDVSGANNYTTGTVTVTNGSTTVQGAGTLWLANVAANYMFHCTIFASGADGVTNGTATFTSAGGNFQAGMVGYIIQINTKGAYKIANVGGANTITLSDPSGLGWPGAGVGLTYSVMSGMGPFDIASVTGNTALELDKVWNGPTLTGLAYITYNPIRAIGDVTGQIWGVGGTVRITGSNNDQTAVRGVAISASIRSYRLVRGFSLDTFTGSPVSLANCQYVTFEDSSFVVPTSQQGIVLTGASQLALTVRRCLFSGSAGSLAVSVSHTVVVTNSGHLVSNCYFWQGHGSSAVIFTRVSGATVRNCFMDCGGFGVRVGTAFTIGTSIVVCNNVLRHLSTALTATVLGEICSNFNDLYGCTTNYTNVAAGASDVTYPPLTSFPLLSAGQAGISGFRLPPPMPGELSQWSQVRALAGFGEAPADMLGIKRPGTSAKNSWGPVQYQNLTYDTATVRTAGGKSLELSDAGRAQVILASINRPLKVRVYVYREANYAGINPQLIVKQSGQADVVITDAGGGGVWNVLEASLTPAAYPGFIVIEYVSNNTALAGAYAVYFDDSMVSSFYSGGRMDSWVSDARPANAPTTSGVSRAFAANGEGR